jgi:DNA polymerase elongation subunit (family B)
MVKPFPIFYHRKGKNIYLREKQSDGKTANLVIGDIQPTLWTATQHKSDYTNINGTYLEPRTFDSMYSASDYIKQYKDVRGHSVFGTKDFAHSYVCDRYGQPEYDSSLIKTFTIDIEVKATEFPVPSQAKFPVDLLTVHDSTTDNYFVLSLYDFDLSDERIKGLKVHHKKFASESVLLESFLSMISVMNPDNITGWHTSGFDVPYLYHRIIKVLGHQQLIRLSPFGEVTLNEGYDDYGNLTESVDIVGLQDLDYLQLYKKHTFITRESYKLDYIGMVEGVGRKVDHGYVDLNTLAEEDPQTYQVYNIIDVNIVVELDRKLKLLDATYALSYMSLSNYVDTLGTTKQWQKMVYAHLLFNRKQLPDVQPIKGEFRKFPGGFVMEPVPGKHKWLTSFDFASLYPHLIMHYNLGPDTYLSRDVVRRMLQDNGLGEYAASRFDMDVDTVSIASCLSKTVPDELRDAVKVINVSLAPNGTFYDLSRRSFFAELMDIAYTGRKSVKKEMLKKKQEKELAKTPEEKKAIGAIISALDAMQMAYKILMNSCYGAVGNQHFHYFLIDVAEAITTGGQTAIQWVSNDLNDFMSKVNGKEDNYVRYIDTDSCYISMESIVDKYVKSKGDIEEEAIVDMLDTFCESVVGVEIEKSCQNLANYLNAYEQKLIMKREAIASCGVYTGKKRYTLAVWDNEGVRYKEPGIKVTGLEYVRSTTPSWAKDFLKRVYTKTLLDDEMSVHSEFGRIEKEFKGLPLSVIAMPTGVNGILKYTDPTTGLSIKGTPIHVRAAINHNRLIQELGLKHVGPITDSNKIKYLILKPNPRHIDVVAFKDIIPPEFELEEFIDRDASFKKSFLEPAKSFLDVVGWSLEKRQSLDDSLFD